MSGRVLVVGCGFPQLSLVRAARALDLHVAGVDANPSAIGARECAQFVRASTSDEDAVAAAVRSTGADGIVTCGSEVALRTAARVAHRLGLPFYADPQTIERCQAKDQMREAYARGGAPTPPFTAARDFATVEAFVRDHDLPLVLKPSAGWGQRGVAKVEREGELRGAYEAARTASSTGTVIVESFVAGKEYSVNAYTLDGATTVYSVTERVITQYPDPPGITFAEWYPSGLDDAAEREVVAAALAGARALGIVRGPSYTQMRYGPNGAFLVETAHRLGGGLDPDVALLASGVSLFRKILGVALGRREWEKAGVEASLHGGAIGKFLVGEPGRVVAIEGLGEARRMPGVVGAEVYVEVGGVVHPLTDGSKRAGHVLAHGRDRAEADARASAAAKLIRIVTRPE